MKIGILLVLFLFSFSSFAESQDYIVVGISGRGTSADINSFPSIAHSLQSPYDSKIKKIYKLYHFSGEELFPDIISDLKCADGVKESGSPELIIIVNSWGSGRAYSLAKRYEAECGEQVSAFYIIDGVRKPIGPFGRNVPAKHCMNVFQTKNMVRGMSLDNCQNIDATKTCRSNNRIRKCHVNLQFTAVPLIAGDLENTFGIKTCIKYRHLSSETCRD